MGFDSNNYVYWDPNANGGQGAFKVVVRGQPVSGDNPDGSWSNKTSAENGYNASGGPQAVAEAAGTTTSQPSPTTGGKTVAEMRAELAAQDGRWANASDAAVTAEYARLTGGGGGGGGGGSYPIAGGGALAEEQRGAAELALGAQGQNITRYGQMGTVPIVLNPNVNYYDLVKDIPTQDKNAWLTAAARLTGLQREILSGLYDSANLQAGGLPDANTFGLHLQTWANIGVSSQSARQWQDTLNQQKASMSGYMPGDNGAQTPTLAREQAQWTAGQGLLNTLAGLRGPENYFQYANVLRQAEGSPQLTFARDLTGRSLSAFGQPGESTPATLQGLVRAQGAAATGQGPATDGIASNATGAVVGGPRPTGTTAAGATQTATGWTRPREAFGLETIPGGGQMSVRATGKWNPSEQKLWNSMLEAEGYEPEDWWSQHQKAAPKGTVAQTTRFR